MTSYKKTNLVCRYMVKNSAPSICTMTDDHYDTYLLREKPHILASFSSTPFQTHPDDLSLMPMLVNNKKIYCGCDDDIKLKKG